MVSRTSPPHQSISAPVTDMTPFVTCAFADSARVRETPRAKGHPLPCICAYLPRVCFERRWALSGDHAPARLSPRNRLLKLSFYLSPAFFAASGSIFGNHPQQGRSPLRGCPRRGDCPRDAAHRHGRLRRWLAGWTIHSCHHGT